MLEIENLSTAGNFKREINMSFCHKPSKRQIKSNGWQIKDLSKPLLAFCRDSSGFQGKKMVGVDFFVRKQSLPSKKLVTTAKCRSSSVVRKMSQNDRQRRQRIILRRASGLIFPKQTENGAISDTERRSDYCDDEMSLFLFLFFRLTFRIKLKKSFKSCLYFF